jgi:hypothetical protein
MLNRALLVMLLTTSAPTLAQENDDSRFFVRGGAFLSEMKTTVRVDAANGTAGTGLSFERDFRLDRNATIPFFEAGWRFSDDWGVTVEYFGIDRSNGVTIDRPIVVGSTTYPANAQVTGSFRSNLYKAQLSWSAYRTDRAEFGLAAGAHVTDFQIAVEGNGSVGGSNLQARREQRSVLAPLPNVGAYGKFDLSDSVSFQAKVNWFQLKVGDYAGGITDTEANVQWEFVRGFGLGAGYRLIDYRLDATGDKFMGRVRYRFSGPVVFAIARF